MGRNKGKISKRKKYSSNNKFVIVMAIVLCILIVMAVMIYKHNGAKEQTNDKDAGKEIEEVTFPVQLDDGKLEIASVFQYSGVNPDYEDEECEEVGTIQLDNKSEEYLESADIEVKLEDGSKLEFEIRDIPAGKSVLAFEVKNTSYEDSNKIIDIKAKIKYSTNASLKEKSVKISSDGEGIKIENFTKENIKNITIKYHCNIDNMYFGGKSYEGLVEALDAGDETVLDASECYLGEAAVVNVIY